MQAPSLIGREHERRTLDDFVDLSENGPRVLAFMGEPGSGRTSLVQLASSAALAAGRRALTITGAPRQKMIPLSGLSQLLWPFITQIESLPPAHRASLGRTLGLVSDTSSFDLVATGMAVLALLTLRPESPAVLVTIDDASHVDDETLAVLAFVAERADRQKAVLLLTTEPFGMPPQFERIATRMRVRRLNEVEAHALLSQHYQFLHVALRRRIVDQSAGNPLVLLETGAAALLPGTYTRPMKAPLRVGPLVEERIMTRFRSLPETAQEMLRDAAVAEMSSWADARPIPVTQTNLAALEPAERSRLVTIDQSGVRFVHPAFWITILHTTPFSALVHAHRRVAAALMDDPGRRAWHLGRCTLEADESVAAMLEQNAPEIGRAAGRLEEALALERAAELSLDSNEQSRRLLAAAAIAAPTGELDWIDELTARAIACSRDPRLRVQAVVRSAWVAAARGQFSTAMGMLSRAATEAVDSAPEAAWEVLSIAAAVGYQSGSRATQTQMQNATRQLAATQQAKTSYAAARSLWIDSYLRPGIHTQERLARLGRLSAEGLTDEPSLSRLAGAAWLDDESETAFELADAAYHRLAEHGSLASAAVIGPILSWTALDTGRWDEALELATDTSRVAEAAGGGMLQATGDAVAAMVYAMRGQEATTEARVRAASAIIQGEECNSIAARAHHALGLSAMASGNFTEAYAQLSRMFREDGFPLHFHISYFGLGDLAAAALRSDQLEEARTLLRYVLEQLPPEPSIRIQHIVLRARALTAENDTTAQELFEHARRDPTGSRWPFERAQLLLDFGALLRRRKRIGDAKPLLIQARDLFDNLGAAPWTARAEAELRACHVDIARPVGNLEDLTDQQREIVLLAGQGLTNREIAARLYLSPRTVSSHLYRSFPKLGIHDRWQLRDLIAPSNPPADPLAPPSVN